MLFGKHIKQAREQKKMSQEELAFLLNTTQKTVSNFESDKSTPTLQQLFAIEKELEIDILKLLSENGVVFNLHNTNSENAYIIKKKSTKLITKLYE